MKKLSVVGTGGLVGKELIDLISASPFAHLLDLRDRDSLTDFSDAEIVFLCTPSDVSSHLAPQIVAQGAFVIDLSSAFRKEAPLILPEVNGHLLSDQPRLVSSPNCVVSILLPVIAPLHAAYRLKGIDLSTYQAASGAGKEGVEEFVHHSPPRVFPYPLHHNLFLHEKGEGEEEKIIFETKKILDDFSIQVHARCVRVPVLRAHSISATCTFHSYPEEIESLLEKAPGITFHPSPHPQLVEHQFPIYYGPIRRLGVYENSLNFWIVGDQLLKGAALNAWQIALSYFQMGKGGGEEKVRTSFVTGCVKRS